ncbi:hypothetical protein [Pinibacter soli]|uniref:MoxR-vWA-beta-propeller ternary system domain-containing protein n=1 Tax=Pinibacter soli TaxID=3044211 RepID=A0ABT6RA97_9BACT|nr:hypothetical protein [Pinibacter soli]MDI3319396.1 hypothetical protein [Pinibacter soli]
MAKNATDNLTFFVLVNADEKECLGGIRDWLNLSVGFEGNDIWVKGFDYAQINSLEIKSIPFKSIFYTNGDSRKLFPQGSLLPQRAIPALLWTPMERALPVTLPSLNHNYFGIKDKAAISLERSETEREAVAMYVYMDELWNYIETAPAIRLQALQWVIVDHDHAFIIGKPLLPVHGEVYWRQNDFFIPAGYDFDLPGTTDFINTKINIDGSKWIVWNADGSYFTIDKEMLSLLSLSSFRLSLNSFK